MLINVNMNCLLLSLVLPVTVFNSVMAKVFKPTWEDLDTRPMPRWYNKGKIGILLHWGVYSVPSFGGDPEYFWKEWIRLKCRLNWFVNSALNLLQVNKKPEYKKFMAKNYPAGFIYEDFAPMFTAEFFDPEEWATLFQQAGAKYVVLTSKHHDGFTLFPAKQFGKWSSADTGPRRDLVGELSESVRKADLKFGVYYSLLEWFNPNYIKDKLSNFKTNRYPQGRVWPNIKQLVNNYKPSVLWADGDWEAPASYWNSTGLLAWLYNESPVKNEIVTNDRWCQGCVGKHGGFYTFEDRYNPGILIRHKWENAFSLDKSWGYRRHVQLSDIMSFDQLLYEVVSTVSCGGNTLINVGPTKEGTISLIFQERLLSLGKWLSINGEAIYESIPWRHQKDSANQDVWYTCRRKHGKSTPLRKAKPLITVYATMLKWPTDNLLTIADVTSLLINNTSAMKIYMLGHKCFNCEDGILEWNLTNRKTHISLPNQAAVNSSNAWTLKITAT